MNNLENNIEIKKTKIIQCVDCDEWIEIPIESKSIRCTKCKIVYQRKKTKLRIQNFRKRKCNAM